MSTSTELPDTRRVPGSFPNNLHPHPGRAPPRQPPNQTSMSDPSRPLLDLRSLDYVSPIDDNLICSVCHCAFIEPVITAACEHIFCGECFASATAAQRDTCPFCRTTVTARDLRAAPRALSNMADDLKVRCPYAAEGCDVVLARGSVQVHVDKYCGFAEVDCPAERCLCKVRRKDRTQACRHNIVACEDCRELIVQKDLDAHRENECQNRWLACDKCDREILHCQADVHESDCPELEVECTGAGVGCRFTSRRAELPDHTSICPFATLAPFIEAQTERINTLEDENKLMKRRMETYGVGGFPQQAIDEVSRLSLVDSSPPPPSANLATSPSSPSSEPAPFDTAIHHLLSSYESLRSDIERLSSSISELDARQSLMQMNESLRIKEDLSHLNAVIGSMRVQLHWLMSTRLQGQPRVTSAGPAGATGTATRGQPSGGQPSAAASTMSSVRRLSDSTRQDTKL
ncbi:MAG: hypothetical protein M1817_005458 [Caeruleum heppii]|nr:MAG: hypothetical protein M1817_005458 [Caeruleum heppii]